MMSTRDATNGPFRAASICVFGGSLLASLLAGCSPQALPTPQDSVVQKSYAIPCDEAFRHAAKALEVRGLTIADVQRGPAGGTIVGKSDKEEIEITLACGPQGVTVAASGGHWMEQGIRMSISNLVDRGDRIWPPPKGPKIVLDRLAGPKAKIAFPQELEPLGLTAIHMRALNGGTRVVRIDPVRIVARSASGGSARAISPEGVKGKLGAVDPAIDAKLFGPTSLSQGEEARGYVFLPPGEYESVVVNLVDVETGEADEFEIFLH